MSARRRVLAYLVIADFVSILGLILVSSVVVAWLGDEVGMPFVGRGSLFVLSMVPFVIVLANLLANTYDVDLALAGTDFYGRIFRANFVAFSLIAIVGHVFDVEATRPFVFFGLPLGVLLQTLGRRQGRKAIHFRMGHSKSPWKLLIVAGHEGSEVPDLPKFMRAVAQALWSDVETIKAHAQQGSVDSILVTQSTQLTSNEVRNLCWIADEINVSVWFLTDNKLLGPGKTNLIPLDKSNVFSISPVHLSLGSRVVKRSFDLLVGFVLAVLLVPLLVLISMVMLIVDGRPIFFRQERVGLRREVFKLIKFRTMIGPPNLVDPPTIESWNLKGTKWTVNGSFTKTGMFLRRWSLDELPQLINVLGGSMSLVGPRPRMPVELPELPETSRRLQARPGVTGLWQVSGRAVLSFSEADALDVQYVDNWSLTADIALLFRTVKVVLSREGAF